MRRQLLLLCSLFCASLQAGWGNLSLKTKIRLEALKPIGRMAKDHHMAPAVEAIQLGRDLVELRHQLRNRRITPQRFQRAVQAKQKELASLLAFVPQLGSVLDDALENSSFFDSGAYQGQVPLLKRLASGKAKNPAGELRAALADAVETEAMVDQVAALVDALTNITPEAFRRGIGVHLARKAGHKGAKAELVAAGAPYAEKLFAPLPGAMPVAAMNGSRPNWWLRGAAIAAAIAALTGGAYGVRHWHQNRTRAAV